MMIAFDKRDQPCLILTEKEGAMARMQGLRVRKIKSYYKCPTCKGIGSFISYEDQQESWEIDTVDKAEKIFTALHMKHATRRVLYLFQEFPEIQKFTHEQIAYIACLTRESVTRSITSIKKKTEVFSAMKSEI
jgi:hypothetical protein